APVLSAHARDARTSGSHVQSLVRESRAIVGAHLTPVRPQPLLERDPHMRFDRCGRRTWLDAADQIQPVRVVLVQVGIDLHVRFGIQRQKEIGCSIAQRVAEETRWSDSHDREWLAIYTEAAADNGRVRSILLLPQAIAHHCHWRSAGLIVLRRERTPGIRLNAEHCEVITRDKLARMALRGL